MKEVLLKEYNNLKNLKLEPKDQKYVIKYNFIKGAFVEILGEKPGEFEIEFFDKDKNEIVHKGKIGNNMWTRTNIKYYVNYHVKITDLSNNEVIFDHHYNPKGKRVYIHLDSKALGDTLAWFPYVDEFRKKYECKVIVSTFHNEWFKDNYPELKFVPPGSEVYDLYAMYGIGWYYDDNEGKEFPGKIDDQHNPTNFRTHTLGKTATSILGLKYIETKPKLTFRNRGNQFEKYVCIAPHASAHAKYWMYPGGWQTVIDYLNDKGYKVLMITHEPLGDDWHDSKLGGTRKRVIDKTGDYTWDDRDNHIMNAELFIGLGSGLSWLSWAGETKTILISGFSKPYSEFMDCERIFTPDPSKCNGCFNRHRLQADDWEWCPDYKDTDRMFECTKSIKPSTVIDAINRQLGIS